MSNSIHFKLEKDCAIINGGWKTSNSISGWAYLGNADEFENIIDDFGWMDTIAGDEESITYVGISDNAYPKLRKALAGTKYANLLPAPPADGQWDDADLTLTLYY